MCDVGFDSIWEDVLDYIEDGPVIPIIGQELLEVEHEGEKIPLYRLVARQLGANLKIPSEDLPPEPTINDVVCLHLQNHGRREDVYRRISRIMKNLTVEPPDSLRKLASIKYFDLIVSVTFDSLMARALEEVRSVDGHSVREIAYSPSNVQDLPSDWRGEDSATVFHLLGKVSSAPDYVTTEEDMLEFLYALQSDARRPNLLIDELKSSHLLIIGCEFSDWLARFFIRIAKNSKLSQQRGEMEVVVDSRSAADSNLALFLSSFSYSTRLLPGSPLEFVDKLYADLEKRGGLVNSESEPPLEIKSDPVTLPDLEPLPDMEPCSVFISYAHEDVEAAVRLRDFLDKFGIDAWLDKRKLQTGHDYEEKIRRNIKSCSFFMPVLSKTTIDRHEGFFRREWRIAIDRAQDIGDHIPFILPVAIDDVPTESEAIPIQFQKLHWARLPAGEGDKDFGVFLVMEKRNYEKRMKA